MEDEEGRYSDYNLLGDDGSPAAGVCHARGVNLGLPPVWMIYLPVGDLARESPSRRGGRGDDHQGDPGERRRVRGCRDAGPGGGMPGLGTGLGDVHLIGCGPTRLTARAPCERKVRAAESRDVSNCVGDGADRGGWRGPIAGRRGPWR